MKELIFEVVVRWEVHAEVNIKIMGEKVLKGKNPSDRNKEKFWGVTFSKVYSILLEIVQIMCQDSLK